MHYPVSIVIPAFNSASTIVKCLEAIRLEEGVAEIIVVDDGSDDNTVHIAKEYESEIIVNSGRMGPSYSRNEGARKARSPIVVFIDSDIIISPGTIPRISIAFEKDPDIGALQGRFSEDSYYKNPVSQYKNLNLAFREIVRNEGDSAFLNTSLVAIKKEILQKYMFDEELARAEDSMLGWRLFRDGYRIVLDKGLTGIHMKRFSLFSFTAYQFRSGRDLLYNWKNKGMGTAVMSSRNATHNKMRILRAPLSGLFFADIALAILMKNSYLWAAAGVLFLVSVILQYRFLLFLIRQKRFFMLIFSLVVFLYDGFVSGLGVAWGMIKSNRD